MNLEVQAIDGMPAAQYHAHDSISNSKLTEAIDCIELYHGRFITKTIPLRERTEDMAFGDLFHEAVLFGVEARAIEIPKSVLTKAGARNGHAWDEFLADCIERGLTPLKATGKNSIEQLRNMVDAVWSHPKASVLLNPNGAAIEQSIFWTDERTGLPLRARLDHRTISNRIITDLKSAADVTFRATSKALHERGYYRQCPFYMEAAKALTGEPHGFAFVFAEKEEPFRVRCRELDPRPDRALTRGYEDMRGGLDMLAEAYRTNNWHERGWDEVLTLDLPGWAYSNQWEFANGNGD